MAVPFLLKPSGKDYLWGGSRLNDDFAKGIDMSPLAETWECSTHPDGPSWASSGEFEGMTLKQILDQNPEFLGHVKPTAEGQLPILVKFIDAFNDLSVQVHPDDEYAFTHENGQLGKNEMWYVVDAMPGAELVFGLSTECTKEQVRQGIKEGTLERYLHKVKVKKNDVFYITAGTIHAIGKGALIAEIQQSSNLTYRLYDYDRKDKFGNTRALHVEKALDVSNLSGGQDARQSMRVLHYRPGFASELLCRCPYFQVERYLVRSENRLKVPVLEPCPDSYRVLLCTEGSGIIRGEGFSLDFFKGDCIFVPATCPQISLQGIAQLLCARS